MKPFFFRQHFFSLFDGTGGELNAQRVSGSKFVRLPARPPPDTAVLDIGHASIAHL